MQQQADELPLAECPECGDYYPNDGPDGLVPHIVGDHRDTELARFVMSEMENDLRPPPRYSWGFIAFWFFYAFAFSYIVFQVLRWAIR